MGASQANGLGGPEGLEPHSRLHASHAIPSAVDYSGMEDRKNPRQPIFRNHNCWKCREGELPCAERNYNCCSYPRARND